MDNGPLNKATHNGDIVYIILPNFPKSNHACVKLDYRICMSVVVVHRRSRELHQEMVKPSQVILETLGEVADTFVTMFVVACYNFSVETRVLELCRYTM